MDRMSFWKLIELIDKPALLAQDEESAAAPLIKALEVIPVEELRSFDAHLKEVLSDIEGDEYSKHAGISGNSDDGFRYLRQFVVGRGQAFYENVKNNPKSIPNDAESSWFEYLDLIAPEVWEKKTGRANDDWYKDEQTTVLKNEAKPFKIIYRNDVDDVIALNDYFNTMPVAKFRLMVLRKILPTVLLIVCAIISLVYDSFNPIIVCIIIIILSEARLLYQRKKNIRTLKATAKSPENKGFFCEHSLEITEDGLIEKTTINERKDLWSGIKNVIVDKNRVYIYLGNKEQHIINSTNVISGDLKAFINEIRRMTKIFNR